MSELGVRVTVTDLKTGESESREVMDDYVLVAAGSCYQHHVQVLGSGGTHVITVKGRRVRGPEKKRVGSE